MPIQSDLSFTFEAADAPSFDVVEFTFREALSETFVLELELSCEDPAVDFEVVLDRHALFTIWRHEQPVRYVHGVISTFVQGETGFRRTRYRAVVEPRLARLRLNSNWRIFQNMSVPEIAKKVLRGHGVFGDYRQIPTETHQKREYCVQAGDTDYDFLERIMREEGFFFAFHHEADRHELVHSDRLFIYGRMTSDRTPDWFIGDTCELIPEGAVLYQPRAGCDRGMLALHSFSYEENVRTAQQTQRDYAFRDPKYRHEVNLRGVGVMHQADYHERYEYPGRYKSEDAGKLFTKSRLRGRRGDACIARVKGDDPRIMPGVSFQLLGHPREDMNRGWRPIVIEHRGVQYVSQAEESAGAETGTQYSYEAELVPDDAEWRPEPLPVPRIEGPQPATVVGPVGEEIHTDQFGRVKVQFPWDREGKKDDHSSCWIRVAQQWAGGMWGFMAIPRIGQEVIVDFFDGDPDQPIITGRTYNLLQPPPYELPHHKTRMTIKSQTHKGDGFNEMRFEDEAGQEEIYVHAQRDQNIHVNHDETTFVGHDRGEQIGNDETQTIGRDRAHTIGQDEKLTVIRDRHESVGQDHLHEVGRNLAIRIAADHSEEVGNNRSEQTAANHAVKVGGNLTHTVEGEVSTQAGTAIRQKTVVFELQAKQSFVIKGPGGSIRIDDSGLTLDAVAIHVKGPLSQRAGGGGNTLALAGNPDPGKPVCVGCLLKAIAEGRSAVRMEGTGE